MLTPAEAALAREAVTRGDGSVAHVMADSLTERGSALGEFMRVSMLTPRDLVREHEQLPKILDALDHAGLRWAGAVAFERGLPVAAHGHAERFWRMIDEATLQWPLSELSLFVTSASELHAALRSPQCSTARVPNL